MRGERLKEAFAEGRIAYGLTAHFHDPWFVEMLGVIGYDWVSLVLEHSSHSVEDVARLQLAADVRGIATLVHLADADDPRILPLLNVGVGGILLANAESADDVGRLVAAARFPPAGNRGAHLVVRSADYGAHAYGDYVATIDESIVLGAIIETVAGVEAAREIASVAGLDVVYIGLADLAQSLGVPGRSTDERVLEAVREIAAALRGSGVVLGISDYGWSAADVAELGIGMVITPSSDWGFIRSALAGELEQARGRLA